jgi:hypothetical protein
VVLSKRASKPRAVLLNPVAVLFARALRPSPVLLLIVEAVRNVWLANVARVEVEVVAAKPRLP